MPRENKRAKTQAERIQMEKEYRKAKRRLREWEQEWNQMRRYAAYAGTNAS